MYTKFLLRETGTAFNNGQRYDQQLGFLPSNSGVSEDFGSWLARPVASFGHIWEFEEASGTWEASICTKKKSPSNPHWSSFCQALSSSAGSAHAVRIQSHELEVKCSSVGGQKWGSSLRCARCWVMSHESHGSCAEVPKFQGELGQDSVRRRRERWFPPRSSGKSAKTNLHALTFSIHFSILLSFLYYCAFR